MVILLSCTPVIKSIWTWSYAKKKRRRKNSLICLNCQGIQVFCLFFLCWSCDLHTFDNGCTALMAAEGCHCWSWCPFALSNSHNYMQTSNDIMELFSGLVNCSAHSYNESAQQLQSVANKCAHFALVQNQAKQAQRCLGSLSMSCGKRFLI